MAVAGQMVTLSGHHTLLLLSGLGVIVTEEVKNSVYEQQG